MKWFEDAAKLLQPGVIYPRSEMVRILKQVYPYVSDNSYHWGVNGLLQEGLITKVGYDQYMLPTGEERAHYVPGYSDLSHELMEKIIRRFPAVAFVIFETVLMNEFLNHLVAQNTVFIQVEKDASALIFRFLQEEGYHGIMYKPTRKEFGLYWVRDGILITDLVTEAPLTAGKPHEICIEKLLVDMFCDRRIGWTYSKDEYKDVVERAAKKYLIDKVRLLRYARRRGKENEIVLAAPEVMGKELLQNAVESRRNNILDTTRDIIESLPESQRELFRDINGGKLSQAEMARYYGSTPQAITNRINRLYKTVTSRLVKDYGFSMDEIKRIGQGTPVSFFRHVFH